MADSLLEDKRPILMCSICNFEVKSVPSMENHLSAVHGLKLKLEIIDSNNTETPVPKVAQTTEITESGETLSQINDSPFSINEAQNTENQSAKSNHPVSGNANTEMEAKGGKSIGLLRSFRMNKQKKTVTNSNQNSDSAFTMQTSKNREVDNYHGLIRDHMCKLCVKGFQRSSDLKRHKGTQVHQEMAKKVAAAGGDIDNDETSQNVISQNKPKKNVTNANQNSNPVFTMKKSEIKVDNSSNVTKKPHPCTVCKVSFDIKDELSAHLIEKHGYRRTYQCPICKKKFASKEAIKKHMVENHKVKDSNKSAEVKMKPQQCMICDASFDDRQDLTKHINDVHDSFYKNAFLKKSQTKNPVKEQEQQNLNSVIQKPNVCNFCNRYFLEMKELKEHNLKGNCKKSKAKDLEKFTDKVKTAHNYGNKIPITPGNEENVHNSDQIETVTEEKKKEKIKANKVLKEHLNKDAVENAKRKADSDFVDPKVAKFANFGIREFDRPHKCPLCFSSFRAEDSFISHVRDDHKRKHAFQCSVCDKPFLNKVILESHIIANHKLSQSNPCLVCHAGFIVKSDLAKHVFENHNIMKEEKLECQCPICYEDFRASSKQRSKPGMGKKPLLSLARSMFKQHLLRCLENNKSFKCEMCKDKFGGKQKYEHVSQWNFENEFQWRAHMNSIHNVQNIDMMEPKVHILEKHKSYCQFCNKTVVKSYWKEHMKKLHLIEYELLKLVPEEVCKKCLNNDKEKCQECGCMKCGGKTPVERLIFCEKCQFYIHFECLPHPIESLEELPGGSDIDFFCPSCSDENLKEILDSKMLDGLKNETTNPKVEIEMDKTQSSFNEFDPLTLETQDIILKAEPDIASNPSKNTVMMEPKPTIQVNWEKDQGYCEICRIMVIGWKGHMKCEHQIEYEVVESNVSTQNPIYYPLDISDYNVKVVAPTDLNEDIKLVVVTPTDLKGDIKPVEVFEPTYSKEFNETF